MAVTNRSVSFRSEVWAEVARRTGAQSGQVSALVNTALVPVAVAKDVFTLGGVATGNPTTYTREQIEKLKEEAGED